MRDKDPEIPVIPLKYVSMTREEADRVLRRRFAGVSALSRQLQFVATARRLADPTELGCLAGTARAWSPLI